MTYGICERVTPRCKWRGRAADSSLALAVGDTVLVEEDVVKRHAYTGPRTKTEVTLGKWVSGARTNAARGEASAGVQGAWEGWGDPTREVVDEQGEVWITSSPEYKVWTGPHLMQTTPS